VTVCMDFSILHPLVNQENYSQHLTIPWYVMKELNTQQDMEFVKIYRSELRNHVLQMIHSKISFQIFRYQPKDEDFWQEP